MRLIIAGSRDIEDYGLLCHVISYKLNINITKIISGGARGVDKLGERYAKENNIPLDIFPANWDKYGKKAGYIRNKLMSEHGDYLLALWDGKSTGTKMMIELASDKGLPILIANTEGVINEIKKENLSNVF